jgi:Flp pilus assembly pilin Flp
LTSRRSESRHLDTNTPSQSPLHIVCPPQFPFTVHKENKANVQYHPQQRRHQGWSPRPRRGQALVEYGLLVGLIAVISVAAVTTLGTTVAGYFTAINAAL